MIVYTVINPRKTRREHLLIKGRLILTACVLKMQRKPQGRSVLYKVKLYKVSDLKVIFLLKVGYLQKNFLVIQSCSINNHYL